MNLRIVAILALVLITSGVPAQEYESLSRELEAAATKPERHRLKAQLANAAVQGLETETLSASEKKKIRAEILAHCSDVQLGAMDIWFGDSIVTWARLLLLDGDWRGARSLLLEQAEVLQNIEKNLAANQIPVSSISPVAGCRYGLGETYRIEYEESGSLEPAVEALKHFYNVHIKYGDSPWGAPAQTKAEAAKAFVEAHGKRVRIELGEHRAAYAANLFRLGTRLEGGAAVEPLTDALNLVPESGISAAALRNLGVAFLGQGRREDARMTAEYLCERFGSDTNAPAAVLGIGRGCLETGDEPVGETIFNLYLSAFPADPRRADILSYFAWKAYKAEAWPEAVERFQALEAELRANGQAGQQLEKAVYIQACHPADPGRLERFIGEFPGSDLVPEALGKKAQTLLVSGHFDAAFQTLETLGERYPDAPAARTALAGLIVAAVENGRFDIAGQVLDRMLEDKNAYGHGVYVSTGKGLLASGQYALAEKAFRAVPPNAPRSLVEQALSGLASAQFGQAHFDESFQTLETLLATYPDSGLFYDARLMQARSLVRLGQTNEALAAFGEVVAAKQDYAIAFEMAPLLPGTEERLAAYQRIALLADPGQEANRPLIADSVLASLPLCIELQKFQLAIDGCDQFATLFPDHDQLPTIGTFRKEAEHALAQ